MNPSVEIQALAGQLDRCEISRATFVEGCTRLMASAIDCTRTGIWLFEEWERGPASRCLGLFDRDLDRVVYMPDAHNAHIGPYFEALERDGHVMAHEISEHPATCQLFNHTANVNNVRSLLAAAFLFNGSLFGAFTCSEVHRTRNWTQTDLAVLKRIGNRATLALSGGSQTRPSTLPMPL